MARPMTVLEFEETEREALKSVFDSRRFNAIVKPIAESLREKAEVLKDIGSAHNVRHEDVAKAKVQLDELKEMVGNLPASEGRDELMQDIDSAQEVLEDALALS